MADIYLKMLDVDQANLIELIDREKNIEKKVELYKRLTEILLVKQKIYKQQLQNLKNHEITEEHF